MEKTRAEVIVPSGRCCICSDERSWAQNLLVFCDGGPGCDIAVHQGCYGIIKVPKGPWYCRKCETLEKLAIVSCELCPLTDGAFKRTDNGVPQVAGLLCEVVGSGKQELQYHGYCMNHFKKRDLSTDDVKRNTSAAFNRDNNTKKAVDRQRRSRDKCRVLECSSCSSSTKVSENSVKPFVNSGSVKKAVQTASKKEILKVKSSGSKSKKDAERLTGQKGQDKGRICKTETKSKRVLSSNSEEETIMRKKPKTSKPKNLNQERPKPPQNKKKPAVSSVSSTLASAKGTSRQEFPAVQRAGSSQNAGKKKLNVQKSSLKVPASKLSKSMHKASLKASPPAAIEERSSGNGCLRSARLQNSRPVLMPTLPNTTENEGLQKCPSVDRDESVQSADLSSLGSAENANRDGGCDMVQGSKLQSSPASEKDLAIEADQLQFQKSDDSSTPICLELPEKYSSESLLGEVFSMEQLLEKQWNEGHELLLEQANFDHVLETLKALHQLKMESHRLEEQVRNLTREKERLLLLKSQLSFSFLMPAANSTFSSQAPTAFDIRNPCAESWLPHQNTSPFSVQDTFFRRQSREHSSAFATFCCPSVANARKNSTSPTFTHSSHQLAMNDILKALNGVSLTTDMVLPESLSPITNRVVPVNEKHEVIPPVQQKIFSPSIPSVMSHLVPSAPSFSQSSDFSHSPPSILPVALPSEPLAALPDSRMSASSAALPSLLSAADGQSLPSTSPSGLSSLSTSIHCSLPSDSKASSPSLQSATDPQSLLSAS